jgi:hypothetical protein
MHLLIDWVILYTIFFDRHTELNKNVPLKPHQKELIKEWLDIRNDRVRPIIAELKQKKSSTSIPDKRPTKDIQNQINDLNSKLSKLEEKVIIDDDIRDIMDSDFYLISTKLDQDHWHVQNAIMHFMEVMTLDKLAFEKTTLTVLNSFLKSVTDSVVDSVIDIVAEKIPIFKIASIGLKAYRDAKAEYEKSIEAHESLNLVNFINQYRISYTKYHERIKSEVFPEIAKVLRDMLKKASDMEAKKFLAFLIHMISKFVIQFISKPVSWYILQLCKSYIEINKGFIVMAVSISYYNKETRSILVNHKIFKIRNKKASNLEKLLNEVITEVKLVV